MRLKFQERSELEFVSRIIPEAKRMGINDTFGNKVFKQLHCFQKVVLFSAINQYF
jgi:hypothetical protein